MTGIPDGLGDLIRLRTSLRRDELFRGVATKQLDSPEGDTIAIELIPTEPDDYGVAYRIGTIPGKAITT